MSSLQPMVVIGVGSTGQLAVNRFRQYLYAIFQDDLSRLKDILWLMTLETAHGTRLDPGLRDDRILISTSRHSADSLTVEQLRSRLGAPLYFLDSLGIKNTDQCNTFGGAGNVRYKGRLSLWFHWDAVRNRLVPRSMTGISHKELLNNHIRPHASDYAPDSIDIAPGKPIVYIVGALGGGTCSGAFLDLAYLVQRQFEEAATHVYGIFAVPQALWPALDTRVSANFYGSLMELAHYSHLFDFCGMEPISNSIRVDHTFTNTSAQEYLSTFDLAGMIYPRYDLVMCAAGRLAQMGLEIMYNEGEVRSLQGGKSEAPVNFKIRGGEWLEGVVLEVFERFYQLTVGDQSCIARIKSMASGLPSETDSEKSLTDFMMLTRQVFKDQVRPFLHGSATDKGAGGLGDRFLQKCKELFDDRRNILVVQYFAEGVESCLEELRGHWEIHFGAATLDAAKKDALKSMGITRVPERETVLFNILKQDILDALIAEALLRGNFLLELQEHFISQIKKHRSKEELKKHFQSIMDENINQLSKGYKTLQKVDRFGNVLNPKLIDSEIDKLIDRQNPEDVVTDELWDAWMEVGDDPSAEDPVLPYLLKRCVRLIFQKNIERDSMIKWDQAVDKLKDRLRDFENDVNRGKDMFTPASKIHEGHASVKGVPKFLIAPSAARIPPDVTLEYGTIGEPRNGHKPLSFLEDFMVFYEERTDFGSENLKFWERSRKAYKEYARHYECQTIPFDSPDGMIALEDRIDNHQKLPEIEKNRSVWVEGLESFFLDFCFEWSSSGAIMGLSELGQKELGSSVIMDVKRSGPQIDLKIPYRDVHVKIPIYPDCRLAAEICENPEYLAEFLKMMSPIFRNFQREELLSLFNDKVRGSYPPRGITTPKENERTNLYFISTPGRECILEAFPVLYERCEAPAR